MSSAHLGQGLGGGKGREGLAGQGEVRQFVPHGREGFGDEWELKRVRGWGREDGSNWTKGRLHTDKHIAIHMNTHLNEHTNVR